MKGKLPPEALEFFRKQGAKGGRIGGKRRLTTLTPKRRSEIARQAAAARWKGQKKPISSG
jgi:hypothetical protein